MENIIFGIITILLCIIGYFLSYNSYKRNHYNSALLFLVACGLVLYIYVSTDFFLHQWDERYHALVSKNLIKHPLIPTLYDNPILPFDYKNWVGNHIWLHKQPIPLWTMAASMSLFGVNEIALRLPSIIMSSLGIWFTYSIGTCLFNHKVGYLSAFLFSINGLIIELTGGRVATDHIDIFFMFFILLAIFLTIKYTEQKKIFYTILIGMSAGAAILTKWLTGLIILPIWFLIVSSSDSIKLRTTLVQFVLLIATTVAVFLPWQLYIFREFPHEAAWEASFNLRHFTEVIEGRSGPSYYFLEKIRINYGELIYLPLVWFLWKTVKDLKNRKRVAISVWFLVPLLIFSLAKTKMQGYLLFTAPALFIMISEFFYAIMEYKKGFKHKWLLNIVLALLILLPIRYGIERMKPFTNRDRNPQWVSDLKKLNHEHIENGILLNYDKPIEAMFYTDLTAYSGLPEEEVIIRLIKEGYTIIINDDDDDDIPNRIVNLDGVIVKSLSVPDDQ